MLLAFTRKREWSGYRTELRHETSALSQCLLTVVNIGALTWAMHGCH